MYISFEHLPSDSRVWIYQASRSFSDNEERIISAALKDFCGQWSAHGTPLETSFCVRYNRFIILAVNENTAGASGCSIDGSVRMLKELGSATKIDFFDRTKVGFLIEDEVKSYPISELPSLFKLGDLKASSITFNNLVPDKNSFENGWQTSVEKSWLVKYLPKETLSV